MSFLKKLGKVALEVGKSLLGAGLGAISKDVPADKIPDGDLFLQIVQQVISSELSGAHLGLTGDQKRQLAAIIVEQLILKSPVAHGKKLRDPQAFRASVEHLVGDVADILNNFHEDAVKAADFN